MTDMTDITKAVMTEDNWHIVPAEFCPSWVSFDRQSIIVHDCEQEEEHWTARPGQTWEYIPLRYWTRPETLTVECDSCGMHPPDKIAHLWLLHNFDSFAGENIVSRFVSESIRKDCHDLEATFLQGDGYE